MAKSDTGIPHRPGTETSRVTVAHPNTGEEHTIHVPADHNGSRVKVEFSDGETAYTEGWDPAERAKAGERPVVPCGNCGAPQTLTSTDFECSACGFRNRVELKIGDDSGQGSTQESV